MSDAQTATSPATTEGSPLRQVLVESVALKGQLDLKQGVWWEYTGFDKYARALQEEYAKLLELHGKLKPKVANAPPELQKSFEALEKEMQKLEKTRVNNDTASRNAHKDLVSAQIKVAKDLDVQLDAAAKQAAAEFERQQAASKSAKDQETIRGYLSKMEAWDKMDTGGKEIPGARQIRGQINTYKSGVLDEGRPLSDRQKAYEQAAKAEKDRRDQAEKAKQEQLAKDKALKDWRDALAKAIFDATALQDDPEIKEAIQILGGGSELSRNASKLTRHAETLGKFDPDEPEPDALQAKTKDITDLGAQMKSVAVKAVSTRDDKVAEAVAAIEKAVTEPGEEPYMKSVRDAAAEIPGLLEEVLNAYRSKHFDTPPQAKRRDAQRATKEGEAEKFKRVGGWMAECGLGGSPRPGPNGPVFMSASTDVVEGFKTHFSQYQANAVVPADGLKSKVEDAMDALFGGAGPTCPHVTQERVAQRGSPDNARLYISGIFNPGNTPGSEQKKVRDKLQAQLDKMMDIMRARLTKVLS